MTISNFVFFELYQLTSKQSIFHLEFNFNKRIGAVQELRYMVFSAFWPTTHGYILAIILLISNLIKFTTHPPQWDNIICEQPNIICFMKNWSNLIFQIFCQNCCWQVLSLHACFSNLCEEILIDLCSVKVLKLVNWSF